MEKADFFAADCPCREDGDRDHAPGRRFAGSTMLAGVPPAAHAGERNRLLTI